MNLMNRTMSYENSNKLNIDGTEKVCNCEKCKSIENQIVEYSSLSKEEIEQIIEERYSNKDEKTKTFIRKALRKHGDRYDYSKTIYTKALEKVKIICRVEGHESFLQTPNSHLNGSGCKFCSIEKRSMLKTSTLNEFIEKANKVHGYGRYDYSKVEYKNNKTQICIICHNHNEPHEFKPTPINHLNGSGCPLCARIEQSLKQILTSDEFIEKANKKHGKGTYDYSKVKYVNCNTEVIIICHNHEEPYEFKQIPSKHLVGHGCPICGVQKRAKERMSSLSEFIEKANKVHGEGTYDYSKSIYINNHSKLCIICHKHGEFWQTPNTHLRGSGCPKCNKYKGEIAIRNFLIKNQIEFEEQKKFKGCEYKRQLKFDFYLPQYNLCLEFDGEQHFKPHDFSSKLDEKRKIKNLKLVQHRDQIKTDYCKSHNINLLRIKYDEDVEEKLTEYFQNNGIIKTNKFF